MGRWIRVDLDIFNSEWLFVLSAGARLAWVQLLLYTKANGTGGRVKSMRPQVAAHQWMIGDEDVRQMLQAAENDEALVVDDGEWIVMNWSEYQPVDSTGADRQRRFRDSQGVTEDNGVTALLDRDVTASSVSVPVSGSSNTPDKGVKKIPPEIGQVHFYGAELGMTENDVSAFFDHYESNGWKVGKNKMRDWKATLRNWKRRSGEFGRSTPATMADQLQKVMENTG